MATQTLVYRFATTSDGLSEEVTSLAKPNHQPNTAINHPNPEVFSLHAWLLSTKASKRKAFLASLENSYQPLGGQVRRKNTPVNLTDSVAGLVRGKLIPIRLL